MNNFNPNELVLERIRAVEEYDTVTNELIGRYTQIESPSLKTAAEGTTVTDAMGAEITTFYKAQTGTFDFTNSIFSLDLAASQFGSSKEVAGDGASFNRPIAETLEITTEKDEVSGTETSVIAKLSHIPAEDIAIVKVINANNEFGETYKVSSEDALTAKTFRLDKENQKLIFPAGVTGKVFVKYETAAENAVKITKRTDSLPAVRSLLVHAIFHDPCDISKVYAGVISIPRAQIDPSAVEVSLTPDGKHAASYKLQKAYCDETSNLFDIIVSED